MEFLDIVKKIEEASREFYREREVSVGKLTVTIGTLGAEEEASIQEYLSNDAKLAFVYKMKLEVVIRSIRAIDGHRLDSTPDGLVETGEMIDGKPVMVEKTKLIRDLIGKWGQAVVDRLFFAYTELVGDLERDINPDKSEEELLAEIEAQTNMSMSLKEDQAEDY